MGSSTGKQSACKAGDPGSIPGSGRYPAEGTGYPLQYSRASLVAQTVKNPPAMRETWVRKVPWRGHGNLFQYSCLENPHVQKSLAGYLQGVAKSRTHTAQERWLGRGARWAGIVRQWSGLGEVGGTTGEEGNSRDELPRKSISLSEKHKVHADHRKHLIVERSQEGNCPTSHLPICNLHQAAQT